MGVQAQNKVTFRKISTGRDYVVEYAIGSSSTIHPSSGWSSIPQSPSEGLYLWQRTGFITPPETEVQEWTYFLIGYNGTDGQNSAVYKIITNADLIKKSLEGNFIPAILEVQVTRKIGSTVVVYPAPPEPPLPIILGEVIDLRISLNGTAAVQYEGDYEIPQNAKNIILYLHDENGNIIDVKSIPVVVDAEEIVGGLIETGVDIGDKTVTITSNNFKVQNNSGELTFLIDEYGCIDTKLIRTGVMKFYDADGRTIRSINENGDGCTIYYYPVTPVTNTHKKMREDKFSFADDGSVNGMETIWYDIQGEPIRALQQDGTIITYADITSWWDVQNAYIFSDAQYEDILVLAKTYKSYIVPSGDMQVSIFTAKPTSPHYSHNGKYALGVYTNEAPTAANWYSGWILIEKSKIYQQKPGEDIRLNEYERILCRYVGGVKIEEVRVYNGAIITE